MKHLLVKLVGGKPEILEISKEEFKLDQQDHSRYAESLDLPEECVFTLKAEDDDMVYVECGKSWSSGANWIEAWCVDEYPRRHIGETLYDVSSQKFIQFNWNTKTCNNAEQAMRWLSFGMALYMEDCLARVTPNDMTLEELTNFANKWNIPFEPGVIKRFAEDYSHCWSASSMYC